MKQILATAIALLAISSAANAADNLATEPGSAVYSWTGGYIGGQIGYGFGNADYVYEGSSDYDYSNDPDGFLGGIYAGYNHQFANGVVLGLEADVAWGGLKDSALAPGDSEYSATTTIDLTGSARLRLGYAMDRLLPYVAGGVAFGKFNFDEYNLGDFYSSADESLVGWTLGIGAEYALTDNWTLRGEYRYADYGTHDFITQPEDEEYSADIRTHDVRFGVAYKF
ncbi:outer membrane protein [Aminobacter sp. LjRoot7]|uniref:outer membrane protein n=1 Tax=Aminobacter sp. LjRoot7 TaxID=3342335 RepID=UPI003ECCF0DF